MPLAGKLYSETQFQPASNDAVTVVAMPPNRTLCGTAPSSSFVSSLSALVALAGPRTRARARVQYISVYVSTIV